MSQAAADSFNATLGGRSGDLSCEDGYVSVLCWLAKGSTVLSALEKKPQTKPKGPSGSKGTAKVFSGLETKLF